MRDMQPSKEDLTDFKDWVTFTLEMLVDSEDSIKIDAFDASSDAGAKVCIMVSGKRDEIGKIIGKSGLTIDAIRRIAYSIARRVGINHCEILVNGDQRVATEVVKTNGG